MLPYSLKVVWFSLSLAGLLSNLVVLPGFARQFVVSAWIPIIYTVADTVLQGIFCLGLIWKMDLFRMPRGFCVAQTVLTHVAWACLSGVCASVTLSTAAIVFNTCPGFFRIATRLPTTTTLILIFSTIVLVLQLVFLLRLNAAQPVDGMSCDASQPVWVRVLGYAGLTLLLSVPSFVLSVMTAMRILFRRQQLPTKSRPSSMPLSRAVFVPDTLTSLPTRRERKASSRLDSLFPTDGSTQYITPSPVTLPRALMPDSPGRAPTVAKHSKYHLPFDAPLRPRPEEPQSRRASTLSQPAPQLLHDHDSATLDSLSRQGSNQPHSPSPIIFAAAAGTGQNQGAQNGVVVVNVSHTPSPVPSGEGEKDAVTVHHARLGELDVGSDETGSLHWGDSDRGSIMGKDELVYDRTEEGDTGSYVFPPYPRIRRVASGLPPWLDEPADTDPALTRTVVFQLFMACTQILAAITSLVDLFSDRAAPTPFGTQHVAQLLAGWGPCTSVCICLFLCLRYRYAR